MQKRESERFSITDILPGVSEFDRIICVFNLSDKIEGIAVDISLNGLGYEIKNIKVDQLKELAESADLFVELVFGKNSILVGVKNVWHTVIREESMNVCRGGLRFEIISDEERLKLSERIHEMRDAIKG